MNVKAGLIIDWIWHIDSRPSVANMRKIENIFKNFFSQRSVKLLKVSYLTNFNLILTLIKVVSPNLHDVTYEFCWM